MVDALIEVSASAASDSARLSMFSLLAPGSTDKVKLRPVLRDALSRDEAIPVPVIGFDVATESYRIATHAMRYLLVPASLDGIFSVVVVWGAASG